MPEYVQQASIAAWQDEHQLAMFKLTQFCDFLLHRGFELRCHAALGNDENQTETTDQPQETPSGLVSPSRAIVKRTFVPLGPRIFWTASMSDMSWLG